MVQMPKDTILLVMENGTAVASSYDYFLKYLNKKNDNVVNIYYKVEDDKESWIDFNKAIGEKKGTKYERIYKAYLDTNCHVDYRNIPKAIYFRDDDYIEEVAPFDGNYDDKTYIHKKLENIHLDSLLEEYKDDYNKNDYFFYRWYDDDLEVEFPFDITNALISINMIFKKYEIIDTNKIKYYDIKPYIGPIKSFFDRNTCYRLNFNVYIWNDLIREEFPSIYELQPNGYFKSQKKLDDNCMVFYNGVFYTYTLLNKSSYYFKFDCLDSKLLDKSLIQVLKFSGKETTKININKGYPNKYKDSIDFIAPIHDSLVLYNGVDHEYIVEDDCAIMYPKSVFALNEVKDNCESISLSFIKVNDYVAKQPLKVIVLDYEQDRLNLSNEYKYKEKYKDNIFYIFESNTFWYFDGSKWAIEEDLIYLTSTDNRKRDRNKTYLVRYKEGYYKGYFNPKNIYEKGDIVYMPFNENFVSYDEILSDKNLLNKLDLDDEYLKNHCTCSSSFIDKAYEAWEAFDRNTTTLWGSKSNIESDDENQWIAIDLGSVQFFNLITIIFDGIAKGNEFYVETSNDGENWQTIKNFVNNYSNDNNGIVIKPDTLVNARHIRFTFTKLQSPDLGVRIREISFFRDLYSYYKFNKDFINDNSYEDVDINKYADSIEITKDFDFTLSTYKYNLENYMGEEVFLYNIDEL